MDRNSLLYRLHHAAHYLSDFDRYTAETALEAAKYIESKEMIPAQWVEMYAAGLEDPAPIEKMLGEWKGLG